MSVINPLNFKATLSENKTKGSQWLLRVKTPRAVFPKQVFLIEAVSSTTALNAAGATNFS